GQVPPLDAEGAPQARQTEWVPADDEILGNFQTDASESEEPSLDVPIGWEKLLVDAAVIGGRDRWARRLRGLRAEFQAQLRDLEKEDETHRSHIQRRIQQLVRLE